MIFIACGVYLAYGDGALWGQERNRRKPEGSVTRMLAVGCKWLINKGMFAYKVSAGKHPPEIQEPPPLHFRWVEVAHIEEGFRTSFGLWMLQGLYAFISGYFVVATPVSGFGGRGGLSTSRCLQSPPQVDLGGAGGICPAPSVRALLERPQGVLRPCGGLRHA